MNLYFKRTETKYPSNEERAGNVQNDRMRAKEESEVGGETAPLEWEEEDTGKRSILRERHFLVERKRDLASKYRRLVPSSIERQRTMGLKKGASPPRSRGKERNVPKSRSAKTFIKPICCSRNSSAFAD